MSAVHEPLIVPRVRTPPPFATSVVAFFALTFAVTWMFYGAAVAMSGAPIAGPAPALLARGWVLIGTISPAFVALWLTYRAEGPAGMRRMLARVFQWRVGLRWYAFAIGYMAVAKLTMAVVHRGVAGEWPRFGSEPWWLMAAAIPVSLWVQAGEELGWRGFALPRLAARFGFGPASIVLGVMWALWHLPLFWLHGADTFGQSFPVWTLQVIAISVAMAWLYLRTHGSLLLVMLMHASINNTLGIVPTVPRTAANPLDPHASLTAWLGAAVLWAAAAWLLFRIRRDESALAVERGEARGS